MPQRAMAARPKLLSRKPFHPLQVSVEVYGFALRSGAFGFNSFSGWGLGLRAAVWRPLLATRTSHKSFPPAARRISSAFDGIFFGDTPENGDGDFAGKRHGCRGARTSPNAQTCHSHRSY